MGPKRTKSQSNLRNHKVEELIEKKVDNEEKENFQFISSEHSKHLNCPLCKELMIRPMRFHPCGHTFCLNCIKHLIDCSRKFCPKETCLSKCVNIQNDRTAESLIDELKVACTNQGCTWKGEYDHYKKTHKDSCPLKGMGLEKYLEELRRIPIRVRSTLDFDDQNTEKKVEETQTMVRSDHFMRNNDRESDEFQNSENKQEMAGNKNIVLENELNLIQTESQEDNNEEKKEVQNRDIPSNLDESDNLENKILNTEQLEKVETNKKPEENDKIEEEISHSKRISNNMMILNIPFGPSFEDHIRTEQRRKEKYISKQLKNLQ